MNFEDVTTLIGSNNAGKSTVLQALDFFFQASVKLNEDVFHKRNVDEDIEITIEFKNLTPQEVEEFGSAVIANTITIKRTFTLNGDGNLQYSALSNLYAPFSAVRSETNKTNRKRLFNEIADGLDGLERVTTATLADESMEKWESENPTELTTGYLRGFFGAPNVANGKLKKKTSLHLIPAVADANEETTQNKSPIIQLLSEVSKQIFENKVEVSDFIERTNTEFEQLVLPENYPQLAGISDSLTNTIKQYYSDSKLLAQWNNQDGISVSFPKPSIKVEDQGFISDLEHVGHGLQRAALFAIIQFLAEKGAVTEGNEFTEPQSDILLLVEEPEIYQHPHKQSLICEAFHDVCNEFGKNTGIRFQVIFTTHSEKFIDIRKFQSARILRKKTDNSIAIHSASNVSIRQCRDHFSTMLGKAPMAIEAFQAKMHIFSREVCEGFFATKVILVEGVTDKAIIEGFYSSLGRNPLAEGISIIQMDGKTKMDKPLYIFRQLGIPVFLIFDSDKSKEMNAEETRKRADQNRILQQLVDIQEPEDFPDGCYTTFSAFEQNLEKYVKSIVGTNYDTFFGEVSKTYSLPMKEICKTPAAIEKVLTKCRDAGLTLTRFDEILAAVDNVDI